MKVIRHFKNKIYRKKIMRNSTSFIDKHATIDFTATIGKQVYLGVGDYRGLSIGDYSYVGSAYLKNTKVGKFSSIGFNVVVVSGNHPIDFVSTSPAFVKDSGCLMKARFECHEFLEKLLTKNGFEAEIGNDVWIGNNVLIKGGITIGDGAIIGMGSVVTKDVPPYSIVAGNPARLIRYRFDEQTIEQLLESQWWDLSDAEIMEYSKYFNNPKTFLNKFNQNK